jgi:hypothetical protein
MGLSSTDLLETTNPDICMRSGLDFVLPCRLPHVSLIARVVSHVDAIGDCAAGVPRLTHASGEMAKMAVQNALFGDEWRVSASSIGFQ